MTGPGTNTYLVGAAEVAVVDPGPDLAAHVEAILRAVAETGGRVATLLVTHAHADHLPAAFRLRDRTGAHLLAHRDVAQADRSLADGDVVEVGGDRLTAYATPGHAGEHLCFWIDADQLLFSGDLIAGVGTVVLEDAPGALSCYLDSLRRVEALQPRTILPGHGPVVENGLQKVREYLAHRAERDRQIVDVLQDGPASVDTLVQRLYVDTPPALYPMAARNVRAHLERLENAGTVAVQAGRWILT